MNVRFSWSIRIPPLLARMRKQLVVESNPAGTHAPRERSVGRKTASQLQSYGTRLRGDEPRLARDDPRGGHDVAVVGRRVEKILYEERRRPVTEVQAAAQIH